MTARELFENVLPQILRDDPARAEKLGDTICFDLLGEGGGTWIVDAVSKPPRVTNLGMSACSCTVRAQVVDFQAMLEEPKTALALFQQGKIQVTGDTAVATRFHLLLAPGRGPDLVKRRSNR